MATGGEPTRRDRILSAAAAEFAQLGFAGARVERIAVTAGVNKQLLFHYFGSKSGLHQAALKTLLERSLTVAPASKAPAERLRELTTQLGNTVAAHPDLLSSLASRSGDADDVDLAREWLAHVTQQVRQVLQDGQRAGYVRDDVEIEAVAEVVVGATLGLTTASDHETAGRREYLRDALLRMTTDYCSWR